MCYIRGKANEKTILEVKIKKKKKKLENESFSIAKNKSLF
jgi:hypothetical protein